MSRVGLVAALLAGLTTAACGTTSPSTTSVQRAPAAHAAKAPSVIDTPEPIVVDAGSIADELAAVETAIRSETTGGFDYVVLGQREQVAYHVLAAHPDWVGTVLASVPASLRPSIQANLSAADQIGSLNGVSSAIPHWKIISPPAPDVLRSYYDAAQQAYGVPWQYLAAINLIETNMGRIQGLSSAGAQGPMQFMPSTWAYYGHGDVNNPQDAILAAGRYLHAHGAPQDMTRAVYAYNPSMLYVRAVQLYAQQMFDNPRTFLAYYNWQVYVPTASGDVLLPIGFTN